MTPTHLPIILYLYLAASLLFLAGLSVAYCMATNRSLDVDSGLETEGTKE